MNQKRKILYIGNKLAVHGKSPTAIDLLTVKLQEEGYIIITASSLQNKVLRLWDMMSTTFRNRHKVDLVIIDTYSAQNFYYAIIIGGLCKWFQLPYIPILHGGNLPDRLESNKYLSKNYFNKAITNVSPSLYLLKQFKDYGIYNLTYIPNTIEIKNYQFKNRKSISAKLLWVRSFAEVYNPLLALEIVEKLQNHGIEVSLCMVGPDKDGSLKQCKNIAVERNLPISFTGILNKSEWIALSKEYDIFINTTNFDNMPVSVMEAMALGLPVISTNVGGLPFLIDHEKDGILVLPNSAEVFKEAIIRLIDHPELSNVLTQNARKKVEGFDWQLIKQKWNSLLN